MGKHTELYDHKAVTSGFHVEEMLSKVNTHRSPSLVLVLTRAMFFHVFCGQNILLLVIFDGKRLL